MPLILSEKKINQLKLKKTMPVLFSSVKTIDSKKKSAFLSSIRE
jgi:hypothetical protein